MRLGDDVELSRDLHVRFSGGLLVEILAEARNLIVRPQPPHEPTLLFRDTLFVERNKPAENFFVGLPDLDDTIARLKAYSDAGADCLYSPGIKTREQIAAVVKASTDFFMEPSLAS